jgi:aminoglycoside 3-N-acetyltransferase
LGRWEKVLPQPLSLLTCLILTFTKLQLLIKGADEFRKVPLRMGPVEKTKPQVTKADIKTALTRLGLKKGNSVGVHSSLSSFGCVEGGADAVIDALLETVGKQGNVVMSTHSANLSEDKRTPEMIAIGISWLMKILSFDPEKTPVTTGIIPETFRKRKGVIRGLHPSHSVAASGPKAKMLAEGWHRLVEADGYILLIGVGLERCTAMHLAEKLVHFPESILKKITPPKWFVEKYPEGEWEWDMGPYPDFVKLTEPCFERGIMKTVKVGNASLKLVKLRELIDLYAEYLEKDPDLFYSTAQT